MGGAGGGETGFQKGVGSAVFFPFYPPGCVVTTGTDVCKAPILSCLALFRDFRRIYSLVSETDRPKGCGSARLDPGPGFLEPDWEPYEMT